jgi:hypothetical protein
MVVLRVSGPVRRALGVQDVQALQAGLTLPEQVQCYVCHGLEETGDTSEMELSAVQVAPTLYITTWSHTGCALSRILTSEEFGTAARKITPAPGAFGQRATPAPESGSDAPVSMIVDGHPYTF